VQSGSVNEQKTVEIGGREIVAFGELSKYGSNRILGIYPIAIESGQGWAWPPGDEYGGSIDVWGVGSDRGERIAAAYETGELPCDDRDKINRILRPDKFSNESKQ
jgi:hypothetical protein